MKRLSLILFLFLILSFITGCTYMQESIYNAGISTERFLSGMTQSSVAIQGRQIAYLERQGSGETIVLLHGLGANKDSWIRFTRALPKEYRVIAVDLPGHGDNERDMGKTYTVDFLAQGFAETAHALKLDRFHLVGNSMGAWVGMTYTSRNPDRVMTLGLFDTAGIIAPEQSDLLKAVEKGNNILVPTTEEGFEELMKYAFHKEPFIPWPIPAVLARKAIADSPIKLKIWTDLQGCFKDTVNILPDLRLPVLILWGDKDRITHVSAVQVLERYLPNSKTVIMTDCGHMPMVERPKEAVQNYISFLEEHAKAVSGGQP